MIGQDFRRHAYGGVFIDCWLVEQHFDQRISEFDTNARAGKHLVAIKVRSILHRLFRHQRGHTAMRFHSDIA